MSGAPDREKVITAAAKNDFIELSKGNNASTFGNEILFAPETAEPEMVEAIKRNAAEFLARNGHLKITTQMTPVPIEEGGRVRLYRLGGWKIRLVKDDG